MKPRKLYRSRIMVSHVYKVRCFFNDTLFLCGNVDLIEKKATKGKLVRIVFDTAGKPQTTVIFNTVEYGANKTIYDHGWNALAVSPDGKIYFRQQRRKNRSWRNTG
jgi:hypothetical protein